MSLHHGRSRQAFTAILAGRIGGAGLLSAMGTIDHLPGDLAIDHPVARVDLQDLGFQLIVRDADVIAQQFPHGLAGECELLEFLLRVILPGDQAINLVRCEVGGRHGIGNLEVLEDIPS